MRQVTLIDATPKTTITFQLPVSLYERLAIEVEKRSTPVRRVTISEVLRDLIDKGC